jgi:FixJ family two-component response regulator
MVMNNIDMPTCQLAKLLDLSERQVQVYRKEIKEKLREKALMEKVVSEDKPEMLLLP